MTKRTNFKDLAHQLDRLNIAAKLAHMDGFKLQVSEDGTPMIVDMHGRPTLVPDMRGAIRVSQRIDDFTHGIELTYLSIKQHEKSLRASDITQKGDC